MCGDEVWGWGVGMRCRDEVWGWGVGMMCGMRCGDEVWGWGVEMRCGDDGEPSTANAFPGGWAVHTVLPRHNLTHACAHTVYTCIPLYHTTHVHTHTHTHIYTHSYTYTHNTHTRATCTHTHAYLYTHIHTHIQLYTHRTVYSECLYTHTCMQCTYSFICAHWSDIKVHVDAQYMHINTRLNKHVHVRTHAHTHSWSSTTSYSSPEHLPPVSSKCKQLWTPHPPLFTHRESTLPQLKYWIQSNQYLL